MLGILKERMKIYSRNHPRVYYAAHRLRRRDSEVAVDHRTELVIEGFPRTGNTFSVAAFRYAQRKEVRLAHHLHAQAQVIRAAHLRVPCLVLIRNPTDAVLSMRIRLPQFSTGQALLYYTTFYESIERYRDSYVLGDFEEVTADFGRIIERVNAKFGTDFVPFKHTEKNVGIIFSQIEANYLSKGQKTGIARPSATRKDMKESLRKELEAPECEQALRRAEKAYESLVSE